MTRDIVVQERNRGSLASPFHRLNDSFSRSTFMLTSSTVLLGLGGLIFWLCAAREYSPAQVGVAITIVSVFNLLTSMASGAWPQLAMRDGAGGQRGRSILRRGSVACVVIGFALVAAVVLTPRHLGVVLDDVNTNAIVVGFVCLGTVLAAALGSTAEGLLVARRATHFILIENALCVGVRLTSLFLLTGHGALGLLVANMFATGTASVAAFAFLMCSKKSSLEDLEVPPVPIRTDLVFSTSVGFSSIVALTPSTLLPTVVLHVQGAATASYFTIALSITYALRVLPTVVSQTVLAEGGRGVSSRVLLRRALRLIAPTSVLLYVAFLASAHPLLKLYGAAYVPFGIGPMCLLALAAVIAGGNYVLDGMLLALRSTNRYAVANVVGSLSVFVSVAAGAQYSLVWASLAYVLAECFYAAIGWLLLTTAASWKSEPTEGAEPVSPKITASTRTHRVHFIDGLRGLAALIVVVSHCWDTWSPYGSTHQKLLHSLTAPLGLGRWAVTLFIVLSGVSLGLPVWKNDLRWPRGVKRFLYARFKRIVPPYWVAVVASSLLAVTFLGPPAGAFYDEANHIRPLGVLIHLSLLQDWVWRGPAGSTAFWSIAVEFHIYLFFALLLATAVRSEIVLPGLTVALAVAAACTATATQGAGHFVRQCYPGLYALFLLGFVAAQWSVRPSLSFAGAQRWYLTLACVELIGIVAALETGDKLDPLGPLCDLLLGPLFALLVGHLLTGKLPKINSALSKPFIVWMGSSSYSLYLTHAVVVESVWLIIVKTGVTSGGAFSLVGELLFGAFASVAVSRVFYRFVERPFMNSRPVDATFARSRQLSL